MFINNYAQKMQLHFRVTKFSWFPSSFCPGLIVKISMGPLANTFRHLYYLFLILPLIYSTLNPFFQTILSNSMYFHTGPIFTMNQTHIYIYIYIYIYISRSLKRLNKVTKSMYIFIIDLTTNAFQSVYVVSSSGSK